MAVAGNDIAAVKETVETLQETARSAGHTDTSFHAFEVDVSSSKQVNSLFTSLVEKFGIGGRGPPLSIIVNGAGIAKRRPFLELPESEFDDIIDVNLKVSNLALIHTCICYMYSQLIESYRHQSSFLSREHS